MNDYRRLKTRLGEICASLRDLQDDYFLLLQEATAQTEHPLPMKKVDKTGAKFSDLRKEITDLRLLLIDSETIDLKTGEK